MEREIISPKACRPVPEVLHGCNEGQEVHILLGTSLIPHLELPLLKIESKIGADSVSPIDDANNRKANSPLVASRQKKTHRRRDKSISKSESREGDIQLTMKRQSRKASCTPLPTTPLSSTTRTTCLATSSPISAKSLTAIATITTPDCLMSPMDTLNNIPYKEKKSKDSKRKRVKKSRPSQGTLEPARSVDHSAACNPELPTSNDPDVNRSVTDIVNETIESLATTIPSQRRHAVSTSERVQAVKQILNASRHDLPQDPPRAPSDKGQEQKRATKKKLADLSLERESLHNAKPRSSRTNSRSKCSKATSRKKTKSSRQSKARPTQASLHDNIDDSQQQRGTESMPTPNPIVTKRVHSFVRPDAACTTSEVSSRHERRIAARNELEAISTHIRHRSHSRSLRTRESSSRLQVDVVSSLSHGASAHAQTSILDGETTSPITATRKSLTDRPLPYQASRISSNRNSGHSSSSCLAAKSEPTQQPEHREHVSADSTEIDDEENSFACSLDSHVSQNSPKDLLLESFQDDALQIIRMLPPKLAAKKRREETSVPDVPNTHSGKAASLPSNPSNTVPMDMEIPPKLDPEGTRHSAGGLTNSRHPKADLQSFLKHVAVLNDLKALTDLSLADDSAEFGHSELINGTASPTKFRRFQRFFQVKCTLFNILRQETTDDSDRLRQTLLQHYDIEPMDLDFVLEHLSLCEDENIDIRWDLVRMVFFPDDDYPCHLSHNKPESHVGHHSMPTLGQSSNIVASDEKRLWHSNVEFPTWNSLSDSVYFEKSHASSDRVNNDEETVDEQQPCWSPMEEFQEEILELFESVESSMADLPFEQQKERRLVLVQLLQATSEEEAHMTTLSFDDMAEIVRHIRISRKTNTDVQWDMIRDIVFPFGVNSLDSLLRRADGNGEGSKDLGCESSLGNSSMLHQSFRSLDHFDDGVLRAFDYCDRATDITCNLWDMTGEELDVVLQHIQVAIGNDAPIRWDLLGDILYPGDPERQSIFSHGIMSK